MSKKQLNDVVVYQSKMTAEKVLEHVGNKGKAVVAFYEFKNSKLHYMVEAPELIPYLTEKMEKRGMCKCNGM